MSNENSIIKVDTGNISKPATVFIEKMANAAGILYEPIHIVRKAKAEAKAEEIKSLARITNYELEQRAMARLVQEESKKQENIETIIAQSIDKMNENAKSEEMDNDWIVYFFEKCRIVSDKEMQRLWSNILSGEANTPGTYSKRTLDLVSSLDKKEADLFTTLCSFAILYSNNTLYPLILNIEDEVYSKARLYYSGLTQLEAIGFIKLTNAGFRNTEMSKTEVYNYYGTKFKFEFRKSSDNDLGIGKVMLTEFGSQLAPICGSEMNPEFIGYVMDYYNKGQGDVVSMTIDK